MSIAALNWAWTQDCPTATAKLVLLALADKANEDGECWPGMDTVAAMAGVSERQVSTHLVRLEDAGLIVRKRRRTKLGRLGRYTFHLCLSTGSSLPVDQRKSTSGSRPPVEGDRQWKSSVVTTGSPASSTTGSRLPDKKQPPKSNPQEATSKKDPPDFDRQFWERYPKRDGKRVGRKQALEQWRKLGVDDRWLAVSAVAHYAAAASDPAVFCPVKDPWRWLRDRLFDDWQEPAEARAGPGKGPPRPPDGDVDYTSGWGREAAT